MYSRTFANLARSYLLGTMVTLLLKFHLKNGWLLLFDPQTPKFIQLLVVQSYLPYL